MNYPALIRHYNTETQAVICSEECCSTLVFAQLQGVINYWRRHTHISPTLSSQVLKQGSLLLSWMLSRRLFMSFNSLISITVCASVQHELYKERLKWKGQLTATVSGAWINEYPASYDDLHTACEQSGLTQESQLNISSFNACAQDNKKIKINVLSYNVKWWNWCENVSVVRGSVTLMGLCTHRPKLWINKNTMHYFVFP